MNQSICAQCEGKDTIKAHVVEVCHKCGQEKHDYEQLEQLKLQLVMYKAAHRRVTELLQPTPEGAAIPSHDGLLVKVAVIKEAMLLEPELFVV